MDPIYAVILAGDNEDRKVKQGSVVANKALLKINGRNMVDYVLDCYRSMNDLAGVGIVGPQDKLSHLGEDVTVIPQRGDMVSNVRAASDTYQEGWLLLSSCDIPLITPESVRDFLSKCQGADMFYPLISKQDCDRVFPDMRRTWVKLKDGLFTGGNVILIRSSMVATAAGPAGNFFAARKSPLQMAGLVGITTLVKLMLAKLSIGELENKMAKILGLNSCKAVITSSPELGTDVDKETDFNLISEKLRIAR